MDENLMGLLNLAQKGDKEAFGQIYQLFQKRIYRFIYYMIYDKELAWDLTQNTFLKAWNFLPKFDVQENGSFSALLFTIARNLVIDLKRKKKELPLDTALEIQSRENLEEVVEAVQEKQKVIEVLQKLDEFERQLIVLRYFEELDYEEIAQIVGQKNGAIRVRIHRVLKKLKEEMEKNGY